MDWYPRYVQILVVTCCVVPVKPGEAQWENHLQSSWFYPKRLGKHQTSGGTVDGWEILINVGKFPAHGLFGFWMVFVSCQILGCSFLFGNLLFFSPEGVILPEDDDLLLRWHGKCQLLLTQCHWRLGGEQLWLRLRCLRCVCVVCGFVCVLTSSGTLCSNKKSSLETFKPKAKQHECHRYWYLARGHVPRILLLWQVEIAQINCFFSVFCWCLQCITLVFQTPGEEVWLDPKNIPKIPFTSGVVVSTHLKNISQIGNLPQVGVKIKNIWNHHLVFVTYERTIILPLHCFTRLDGKRTSISISSHNRFWLNEHADIQTHSLKTTASAPWE